MSVYFALPPRHFSTISCSELDFFPPFSVDHSSGRWLTPRYETDLGPVDDPAVCVRLLKDPFFPVDLSLSGPMRAVRNRDKRQFSKDGKYSSTLNKGFYRKGPFPFFCSRVEDWFSPFYARP